jgi:hypothetical protein
VRLAKVVAVGLLILFAGCTDDWDWPEFMHQATAIAVHGPTMRAILSKHPHQRMVVHYEPGMIVDVPHYLVYDRTDHTVTQVIKVFKNRDPDHFGGCDITGARIQPDFFDLYVSCDP